MYFNVKLSKRLNLSIYTNIIHTRFFIYIIISQELVQVSVECVNKNDLLLSEMVHSKNNNNKNKKTTNR